MVHVIKVSDKAHLKAKSLIDSGQVESYPQAFDQLLSSSGESPADKTDLVSAQARQASRQLSLDESLKMAKLEGLKLDNEYKTIRNRRIERTLSPQEAMELSAKNSVTPAEETRPRSTWENGVWRQASAAPAPNLPCYATGCNIAFPPGFNASLNKHMIDAHQWTSKQLEAFA